MRKLVLSLAMLALAGCRQAPELPAIIAPYKVDIQQGNVVTQEMLAKLKAGMTRAQVRFALGSPLVVDPFRSDRWDYVYMYQKQGKEAQRRRITIIFEDERLARIEGDVVPVDGVREPAVPPAPAAPPPPAPAVPEPKSGAKAADKPAPAQPEAAAKDEKPKQEKGFFGRMREKIGF